MLQTLKFVANICGGFKQQKTFPIAGKQISSSVVSAPLVRLAPRCRNSWTEKPDGLHVFQTGSTAYFLASRKKRCVWKQGCVPIPQHGHWVRPGGSRKLAPVVCRPLAMICSLYRAAAIYNLQNIEFGVLCTRSRLPMALWKEWFDPFDPNNIRTIEWKESR